MGSTDLNTTQGVKILLLISYYKCKYFYIFNGLNIVTHLFKFPDLRGIQILSPDSALWSSSFEHEQYRKHILRMLVLMWHHLPFVGHVKELGFTRLLHPAQWGRGKQPGVTEHIKGKFHLFIQSGLVWNASFERNSPCRSCSQCWWREPDDWRG